MIERAYGNRFLIYQSDCAEGALEIFQNSRVDLLMSDIRMPGMDGLEMVEIVEKEWPDCLTISLRDTVSSNMRDRPWAAGRSTMSSSWTVTKLFAGQSTKLMTGWRRSRKKKAGC